MAYLVKQISSIMNDIVEDLTGQSAAIQDIDTSNIVSLGKAISDLNLYEGFFGSLVNRLAKTVYFVRVYDGSRNRRILRDEHEFGAFIQKVYFTAPEFEDNTEYKLPDAVTGKYTQHSPYDVETTVTVSAKIFSAQGTFALNIVRPVDQIRSAFLSDAEMMRFIDGIYVTIENQIKLAEEGLVSSAIATAMAMDINGGNVRNLLTEYNTLYPASAITSEAVAMTDPDFLKYASKEINQTIKYMRDMSTAFNIGGYMTFTDEERLCVEVLSDAAASFDSFLNADTFHDSLVGLKGYDEINKWQFTGQAGGSFANNSKIDIIHDDFKTELNPTGEITADGIIAFVHDIEHVAAYFGHRRSWEKYNEIDDVYIHGESMRKGYAVDPNANGIVFIVKYVAP